MAKKLYRFVPERKKNVFLNNLIDAGGNIGRAGGACFGGRAVQRVGAGGLV